jgi:replicative DNA helicase
MTLPFPAEAEHELVASVFVDSRVLADVEDLVSADDFYNGVLRLVWDSMRAVVARDGVLDLPLYKAYLRERGLWERIGGDATITRLLDRGGSTSRVDLYAREVRSFARRRAVIAAAEGVAAVGMGSVEDVERYCCESEDAIRNAAMGRSSHRFITPQESAAAVHSRLMDDDAGDLGRGIPSGIETLDNAYLFGGWPRKLVVVAGRPKMGKTSFGVHSALRMAQSGHAGVIFTMEMTHLEVTARMQASVCGVDSRKIMGEQALVGHDLDRYLSNCDQLSPLPYLIDDSPRLTAHQIRSRCGRAERELGRPLDWCLVDYMNIMSHPARSNMRTDEAMAVTSGILADLAKERNMLVMLIAQLNRKVEEKANKRPEMHHLRECGALEQDAALIVAPFWPHHYWPDQPRDRAELIIMASRFGPSSGSIKLRFWPEWSRYEEADQLYG